MRGNYYDIAISDLHFAKVGMVLRGHFFITVQIFFVYPSTTHPKFPMI